MNRRTLITWAISIWGILVGSWVFDMAKNYFASKDQIPIAYSEAVSLLKNQDLVEVKIRSSTNGHEIILNMKDGKVFSSFSSDPNLYDRILSNPNIKVSESQTTGSVPIINQIVSFVFLAGLVLASGFIFRDTFRRREENELRRF